MEKGIQLFDIQSKDKELTKKIYEFFYKWELLELFTYQHYTSKILVNHVDLLAVLKNGSSYNKTLMKLSERLSCRNFYLMMNENELFELINQAETFSKLINNIQKKLKDDNHETS